MSKPNLTMKAEYTFPAMVMPPPSEESKAYFRHRRLLIAGDKLAWEYEHNYMKAQKIMSLLVRDNVHAQIDDKLKDYPGLAHLSKWAFDKYVLEAKLPIDDPKVRVVMPDNILPETERGWDMDFEVHGDHFIFKWYQLTGPKKESIE